MSGGRSAPGLAAAIMHLCRSGTPLVREGRGRQKAPGRTKHLRATQITSITMTQRVPEASVNHAVLFRRPYPGLPPKIPPRNIISSSPAETRLLLHAFRIAYRRVVYIHSFGKV